MDTYKRKRCVAIVPAAGSSSRMKDSGNKLLSEICGIPTIARTLLKLNSSEYIDGIIIPTREDMIGEIEAICAKYSITKLISVIKGGNTRVESVFAGVKYAGKEYDLIAVHDAARPFITAEIIDKTIEAAAQYNAAAPAVPLKDTIKKAKDGIVVETVPRDTLFAIQTPQVFDSDILSVALSNALENNLPITDDCSAVEATGVKVFLTSGDYFNIKITTPEDLIFAGAIAKQQERAEF